MMELKQYELITGQCEPSVQEHKVPDFATHHLNQIGMLYNPVIDQSWLAAGGERPSWPEDKRFAVYLTHDVDAVSELNLKQNVRNIKKLLSTYQKRSLGETSRKIFEHKLNALRGLLGQTDELCKFERWMNLEKKYGARSTFFFPLKASTYLIDQIVRINMINRFCLGEEIPEWRS